jgi:ankyrin repeat protein
MPRKPSKTAVINAAKAWDSRLLNEFLMQDSAFGRITDKTGRTPLHYVATREAAKGDPKKAIKCAIVLLEAGADINAVRPIPEGSEVFHATPLWTAYARGKNVPLVKWLLQRGALPEHTLWACAWNDDASTGALLVKHGAQLDPVFHRQTPFFEAAGWRRWGFVNWIAGAGANVNYRGPGGETVLHLAVRRKFRLDEVRKLVQLGTRTNIKNDNGKTVTDIAREANRTGVLKVLRE